MLQELENCRFIRQYLPFDQKKRMVTYQLIDPFLHFCYHIQDKCKYQDENFWSNTLNTPLYNAWSGLAFEILCLNHVAQIDLIIDRADHRINLCEMKFSRGEYTMTKAEREKLEHRVDSFITHTKTRSSVLVTLISSAGLQQNVHSHIVNSQVTLKDLF